MSGLLDEGLRIQEEHGQVAVKAWWKSLNEDQRAALRAEMDQLGTALSEVGRALLEALT